MPSSLQRAAGHSLVPNSSLLGDFLQVRTDVLGSQHGGVGGGLVTVGLDLHATGDTGDGLTATGITQVSLCTIFLKCQNARIFFQIRRPLDGCCSDVREIGDVDEGVVEGGEDTGNAEDQLALLKLLDYTPHTGACD